MKRVVVNSTPIISLSIIDHLDLLNIIFDEVMIPKSVYDEIVIKGTGKPGCEELKAATEDEIGKLAKTFNFMKHEIANTEKVRKELIANKSGQ